MSKLVKALFFDIDGTLVSFKTHHIPLSTIQAIKQAKDKVVGIYISTGRPKAIISNLSDIDDLIDGYITANGAYCFVGDKEVSCHSIPSKDVKLVLEQARNHHFACVVVGTRHLCVYQQDETFNRIFLDLLQVKGFEKAVSLDKILEEPILQLSPFVTFAQEQKLMPMLHSCLSGRWHPEFIDITSKLADKGQGLQSVANFLGLPMSQVMAFGDGGNDISIIRKAGIGVAMGNAVAELKEAADYVTSSVDEDGILKALEYYHVI